MPLQEVSTNVLGNEAAGGGPLAKPGKAAGGGQAETLRRPCTAQTSWQCTACTLAHTGDKARFLTCEACGAERPEPGSAPVPAAAAPRTQQPPRAAPPAKKTKLSPRWVFDAALLSSPIDLSALVDLSKADPEPIAAAHGLLERMIDVCLNSDKKRGVDKDTRLDVLLVLGNVARVPTDEARARVQQVLGGVSEWFDGYLRREEGDAAVAAAAERELAGDDDGDDDNGPELHKAMLVLLLRAYDYALKTDDLIELCAGERLLALETIVGLLADGEDVVEEVVQRKGAKEGQRAVWEKKAVGLRYEKPLVVALCGLLRGFTHPDTYFNATEEGFYYLEVTTNPANSGRRRSLSLSLSLSRSRCHSSSR